MELSDGTQFEKIQQGYQNLSQCCQLLSLSASFSELQSRDHLKGEKETLLTLQLLCVCLVKGRERNTDTDYRHWQPKEQSLVLPNPPPLIYSF